MNGRDRKVRAAIFDMEARAMRGNLSSQLCVAALRLQQREEDDRRRAVSTRDPERLTVRGLARALRRAVEEEVVTREAVERLVALVDDACVGLAVEFDQRSDRPLLATSADVLGDAREILESELPRKKRRRD